MKVETFTLRRLENIEKKNERYVESTLNQFISNLYRICYKLNCEYVVKW